MMYIDDGESYSIFLLYTSQFAYLLCYCYELFIFSYCYEKQKSVFLTL